MARDSKRPTDEDVITLDNIDDQLGAVDPNAPTVNIVRKSDTEFPEPETGVEEAEEDEVEEVVTTDTANPEEGAETPIESSPDSGTDDSKIAIKDAEYTREELEQIFALGKTVADYQKEHPGFDPLLLERDYRHKTHELSQYKQKFGALDSTTTPPQQPTAPQAPAPTPTDTAILSEVDPEDLARLKKILPALGYVKKDDLVEQDRRARVATYEQVKQEQVNAFVAKHPECHPQNDPGDKNWNAVLSEFSLYKLPEDPRKIGELLERAYASAAPKAKKQIDPKQAAQILAQNRVNAAGSASGAGGNTGGGSSQTSKKTGKGLPPEAKFLHGFSDDELKEIFG